MICSWVLGNETHENRNGVLLFYICVCVLKNNVFELNKKGYNMIIDDADAAIIANSPIIVFDRQKSLEVVSINEVNREYLKQLGKGLSPSAQHT